MTLAAYTGHEPLVFPDYLDLETGKTLHAEPRAEPYDVAPASGRAVPDVPEGWFTQVRYATGGVVTGTASLAAKAQVSEGASAEGDGAPGDEETSEEPETDASQQF